MSSMFSMKQKWTESLPWCMYFCLCFWPPAYVSMPKLKSAFLCLSVYELTIAELEVSYFYDCNMFRDIGGAHLSNQHKSAMWCGIFGMKRTTYSFDKQFSYICSILVLCAPKNENYFGTFVSDSFFFQLFHSIFTGKLTNACRILNKRQPKYSRLTSMQFSS